MLTGHDTKRALAWGQMMGKWYRCLRRLGWFVFGMSLALAVTAVVIYGLYILALNWVETEAKSFAQLQELANAGEFYNFVWGVPVAAAAILITWLLTFIALQISNRQGDADIVTLIVSAVKPYMAQCGALIGGLQGLFRTGNITRLAVIRATEEVRRSTPAGQITGRMLVDQAVAKAREYGVSDHPFEDSCAALVAASEALGQDPFALLLSRRLLDRVPLAHRALDFLNQRVAAIAPEVTPHFSERQAISILTGVDDLAYRTSLQELVLAYMLLPQGETTIEMVGHALFVIDVAVEKVANGRRIVGYRFNYGAALLLTIYNIMPRAGIVHDTFDDLFDGQPPIASKALKTLAIDIQHLVDQTWQQGIEDAFSDLNRLIVVDFEDGPPEFYDPGKHGPIGAQ